MGPSRGWRTGLVDGIEVIEFDLPYSNHAGLLERALVFLRYSWNSLQLALRSDADLVFATTTPLTAGSLALRPLAEGTPFVFEVRDLWPELPRAMGVVRNPLVLAHFRPSNGSVTTPPMPVSAWRRASVRALPSAA